ncbi:MULTISPECIES: lytic transglycosylase domain-containing protein [Clostridium]|uniref:Lytic transglycosylase catalytic n=2 Tax=root TaxID=1 RepID=R9CGG9_9CLOT|nr:MULTISPECIES: lytic transglycosylase domain-containing protein [Clostridium]EOR28135.1 lytic transglycosylase catalytic [Clostridium sartagoforme AAU1]
MNISKVEEFMGSVVSKEALKKAIGDGPEFDIVYEALLNSNEENIFNSNNEESSESYIPAAVGQKLENIPLRIRTEPIKTGELYLNRTNSDTSLNISFDNLYTDLSQDTTVDVEKIYSTVDKYSQKYGVDKNLVLAIIKQESNFNPNAVSSAGAKGLMQLMDFNSEAYGLTNPYDIDQNIEAGVKHIKSYLDMYNGNLEMALMAYNGGPGTMERRGVKSASDLYKMPQETQNYVPKILSNYRNYSNNA